MTAVTADRPSFRLPLSALDSPREVVRQFTPNWFAATMGTGILALALGQLPVHLPIIHALAETLWLANIGLFAVFTLLYAARWIFYFDEAARIFDHSVMSMFFGCIPMGLATIANGFLAFGAAYWGQGAVEIAEVLWVLDAILALLCGVATPYLMMTRQNHSLEQMTGVWLLPIVACEVAAVTGGLLAPHLAGAATQMTVLVSSYVLWACSVPLALSFVVILVLRLMLHKLPHAAMGPSVWLSLGPIGTGALGLLVLGGAAPAIFTANGLADLGATARGAGVIGGLLLWGYGLWWAAMAALFTVRYLRQGLPFNLGWWGYTFPLGVFSVATLRLATVLPVPAIAAMGEVLVLALAVLWSLVAVRTVRGAWLGELFSAPCLKAV
jgi:C4-dicarboxylate transporter/malic acid transport protein